MKLVNLAKLTFGLFLFEKSSASEVILNQGKKFKVNSTESESDFHSYPTGFCGPKYGYRSCGNEECCSKDGRCGFNLDYCDYGCQEEFGRCLNNNTNIIDPVHYPLGNSTFKYYEIMVKEYNPEGLYLSIACPDPNKNYLYESEGKLTSDMMNNIYDLINRYNYTYLDSGKFKQILHELDSNNQKKLKIINRGIHPSSVKFLFINPKKETITPRPDSSEIYYIPIESNIVNFSHYHEGVCCNIIRAYLSDYVKNIICNLPDVYSCIDPDKYEYRDNIVNEETYKKKEKNVQKDRKDKNKIDENK